MAQVSKMTKNTRHFEKKEWVRPKLLASQILPIRVKKGGKAKKYEDQTKQEIYNKAKEVGIEGRSKMTKSELISALRNS